MAQGTCSIPDCARPLVIREHGWCLMHYKRWRRRGSVHDITPEERFFAQVKPATTWGACWIWAGALDFGGYGGFGVDKRRVLAHRWAYEFLRAEIPAGLHLDHLCRNRTCVNPWHLEPVTPRVNLLRSTNFIADNAAKTHCKRGHLFDAANTYVCQRGRRSCRACRSAAARRNKSAAPIGAGHRR